MTVSRPSTFTTNRGVILPDEAVIAGVGLKRPGVGADVPRPDDLC